MPRELPIFPLPLVLFPGATQALHIFEPRYRRLLADCLEGDKRFGIAYAPPAPRPEDVAAPPLGAVGCVALIRTAQPLSDGRSNILTVGERRFTLLEWVATERPYRIGRVADFEDDAVDPAEAEALAGDVREGFSLLVAALDTLTDRDRQEPDLAADPQLLSFQVAAALAVDQETKLELLALRSTTLRLRRLAQLVGPLAAEAGRRAAVRARARRNGRGGKSSAIEGAA